MLARFLLALAALPLVAGANDLLIKNMEWQQSPFGERGVYQLSNSFSYQSTWGLTSRHDIVETTGSGSVALESGFLAVRSGTTAGSTAELWTVEFGRYQPGRAAEAGIGVTPINVTPGSVAQWGLYTDTNGAYWRLKDDTGDGEMELCVVYETSGTEHETCAADFNGDAKPGTFDPTSDGAIYIIRLNWYGIGGVEFYAYSADERSQGTLTEWMMHRHAPAQGQAFEDPNLPMVAEVTNGAGADDVAIHVGGRRYDIQGTQDNESRRSGDYRGSQIIGAADGLVPMICVRRKTEFPTGRMNTITVYASGYEVETDQELSIYYAFDPDVSGGTWGDARHKVSAETAVEVNTGVTGMTSPDTVAGPFGVGTQGSGSNEVGIDAERQAFRIHLPGTDPVCLAGDVVGGADATVSSWMRVVEEW